MLTEKQRKERLKYIGSTDAAAVLGLSRYMTPLHVWAVKTCQIEEEDISGKLPVRLGHKLEQAAAEIFMEETGKKLHRVNETIYHPRYEFLAANIDRRVVGERAIVEIKNVGAFRKDEWREGQAPAEYICQVMHQLAVTGLDRGYLVALVGNTDFEIRTIERDERALNDLVGREVSFWNNFVIPKVMPTISSGDRDTLSELFPVANDGKIVELTDVEAAMIESLESLGEEKKVIDRQIEKLQNMLRSALGDSEVGVVGPHKVFWTNMTTNRLDVESLKIEKPEIYEQYRKQSTTRRFLIKTNTREESNGDSK